MAQRNSKDISPGRLAEPTGVCAGLEGEGLVAGRYLCDVRVDWSVALSQFNVILEDALRFRHVSRTNPWPGLPPLR